jgi:hypothetical protein
MPGLEVARAEARPRETVTAFLRRTGWATRDRTYGWQFRKGLPTILEINGEAVLRRDWRRRRIGARAEVRFVSYPLGGNGGAKQILRLVSLIAVSAFAFCAGPIVAGALGFGGSALVGGLATRRRTRSIPVLAQVNTAKLGRLKTFPEFGASLGTAICARKSFEPCNEFVFLPKLDRMYMG